MFSSNTDSFSQLSTISFRLKSTATTTLQVQFVGRDIRVCDLKEKIAERLHAQSGSTLILYESGSNRLLSEADEKIPAFSEVLVVRTNEQQEGSVSMNGVGGGGGGGMMGGAGAKEKTAGALGTMAAAKKAALEASARKAELDFGQQPQQHQSGHQQSTYHQNSNMNNHQGNTNNNNSTNTNNKTDEDRILELQDIVGRVEGDRTNAGRAANGFGRGGGGAGGGGAAGGAGVGFSNNAAAAGRGPNLIGVRPQDLNNGRSGPFSSTVITTSSNGEGYKQAPSDNYRCHLCGQQGHWIDDCPKAQQGGGGGRGGGGAGGRGGGAGGGTQHFTRRFAQPIGIPESELERCEPEDATYITRDGYYVKRKLVGLSVTNNVSSMMMMMDDGKNSSSAASVVIIKCMHCQKNYNNDVRQFQKLPCNCENGRIACKKCVDDGECFDMTDDGPVCKKCRKEIDADEIVDAKLSDFPTKNSSSGQVRRDRE